MLDWEGFYEAIKTKSEGDTKAEQLAGENLAFWANFYDLNEQKIKALTEAILLDIRYKLKFEYDKEVLVRLGLESFTRALLTCSLEAKRKREVKK
jgi:hypothetical protein